MKALSRKQIQAMIDDSFAAGLAAGLEALTGDVVIGGDSVQVSALEVGTNAEFGGDCLVSGLLTSDGGAAFYNAEFDGSVIFNSNITAGNLATADGDAGLLFKDAGAANVVKVSA